MVIEAISNERLEKYLIATGHNKEKAINLYGWNILISESFFPILSSCEVCLRNAISKRIISLYGTKMKWWKNPEFLSQIDEGEKIVRSAERKLRRKGSVTSGRMVAELSFGFWTKMLLDKHKEKFWKDFRGSFSDLPDSVSYEQFRNRCEEICFLRNRIFHHEPIFNRDLSKDYSDAMGLVKWMSAEKHDWIKKYVRVQVVLREKPK